MTTRKKRMAIAALILLATVAVGAVALRARSKPLKVHVETIRDEDGHFHRRWTFTGGRWESYGQGTRGSEHFVVLDPPGARQGAPVRLLKDVLASGADRLVYEVEAIRSSPVDGSGPPTVSIKRTLSGNANGAPGFTTTAVVPSTDGPWNFRFQAPQDGDVIIPCPVKLHLGNFGGSIEVIEFR